MNSWAGNSNDDDLFYHTYSMGIWGKYLDEHVGGNTLMRETWETAANWGCWYCAWMPTVVESAGEDFDAVYTGFLMTNVVMDYRDYRLLETPSLTDRISSLPADGEDRSSDRPQSLGANFLLFTPDVGEAGEVLEVSFVGDTDADQWYAMLVRGDETVEESVVFELDENFEGQASIPLDGENPVHLIVSPMSEDAYGYTYQWSQAEGFGYAWSAKIEGAEPDADGITRVEHGEDEAKACGCTATTTAHGGAWLGLLGLLLGFRRRAPTC
jgi:MYXO-CTERM domain-containing protein